MESTDTLRSRIRDLETECKKLTMDMKLKEEQIRDLEGKCQVRRRRKIPGETKRVGFLPALSIFPPCLVPLWLRLSPAHTAGDGGQVKHSHYGPTHIPVSRTDLSNQVKKIEGGERSILCWVSTNGIKLRPR